MRRARRWLRVGTDLNHTPARDGFHGRRPDSALRRQIWNAAQCQKVRGNQQGARALINAPSSPSTSTTTNIFSIWLDPQIYPAYAAVLSVTTLALYAIATSKSIRRLRAAWTSYTPPAEVAALDAPHVPFWRRHIAKVGGPAIFAWKFVRLDVTLALTALVTYTTVKEGWTPLDILAVAALVRRLHYQIHNSSHTSLRPTHASWHS